MISYQIQGLFVDHLIGMASHNDYILLSTLLKAALVNLALIDANLLLLVLDLQNRS